MKVPTTEWVVLTDEDPRRGGGALRRRRCKYV